MPRFFLPALGAVAAVCACAPALAQAAPPVANVPAAMPSAAAPVATAAASARSSLQLYGLLDVMLRQASHAPARRLVSDGAYTGSRLGLRGSEDLGGGWQALFSLEMGLDPSTGTQLQANASPGLGQVAAPGGRAWGREAFVGLKTDGGQLTLGHQYTLAHQLSGRFQPQPNPNDPALSVFSGHHVARQDNMAKLGLTQGPFSLLASLTANEGNGRGAALGASYTAGGVDLVAYAMRLETNAAGVDARRILGLGGAWAATPALKLFAGGMVRRHRVSLQDNTLWTLGATFSLTPRWVFTASVVDDRQAGPAPGHRRLAYAGVNHAFSKRSDLYLVLDRNQITGRYAVPAFMLARGTQLGLGVGLRQRF